MFDFENDINVDSLWFIDKRDNTGKHSNTYHGNFVPQIPNQLIRRYTKERDFVLELFSGSGTTLFECEKLKRNYLGFDINEEIIKEVNIKMKTVNDIKFKIVNQDVVDKDGFETKIKDASKIIGTENYDFLIVHPPYWNIIKFTENQMDLSNINDLDTFIEKIKLTMENSLNFLKKNHYFAIIMGDIYKNSEVIPLGFYVMNVVKQSFKVKLKGIVIKNIEGNRGKLGKIIYGLLEH